MSSSSVDMTKKEDRELCWLSRDIYWKCLDEKSNSPKDCEEQRAKFVSNCSKTWVKYFDRRRDYLKFKNSIDSGDTEKIEAFLKTGNK